jgi:glutamate racemase
MQPIGIFDSGVGGLGIFNAIAQRLPHQDIIYIADNNNLPFGEKTTEQLQNITSKIVDFLVAQHDVKLVVAACNTASTSSLAYLREHFSVPIVGVVPVVKPACEQTKTKKVAILATPFTARSAYQQELIAKYAGDIQVLSIACPDLVGLVEAGELDSPLMVQKLKEYIDPAIQAGADVIGLACTHYPFVRKQIEQIVPSHVAIMDSNEAIARHVERLIAGMPDQPVSGAGKHTFYVTKEPAKFQQVAQILLGCSIDKVSLASLL